MERWSRNIFTELYSIPSDRCGEMLFSLTFVLVAVTTFTYPYVSALITPHWKVLRS